MDLRFFRKYGLTITIALVIMYMCLMPEGDVQQLDEALPDIIHNILHGDPEEAGEEDYADKIVHATFYIFLSFAAGMDFYRQWTEFDSRKMLIVAVAAPILYGGLVEIMQELLTLTRHGDLIDWIMDATGVVIGYLICRVLAPKITTRESLASMR